MLREVLEYLKIIPDGKYVDCTLGGAGHSCAILERLGPDGVLIGLDQDPVALPAAEERLAPYGERVKLVHANFDQLAVTLERIGIQKVNGILYDLGVSSPQLDTAERGFSFHADAPLDMRMDPGSPVTAADLVSDLPVPELAHIIKAYGEERWAGRIAAFIGEARKRVPVTTTGHLAEIVKNAIPAAARRTGPHPARRTFQALRIAVNNELGVLEDSLHQAVKVAASHGRICVISYHSLEDRIVKDLFRNYALHCKCPPGLPICRCGVVPQLEVVTRRPVTATEAEVAENPRSRSAKLRAAEKLDSF
ncbi:MAG: 16S rRNA (cytosine(1402)-N(4))-methyltransferase RsmH [Clostridia bacterium]|nr:16S rRNA (cytosine(1402)-N(4))-methyltransferase RsmH [Clostridia bacterium]MDQ7791467.1 16S rRNA (cytosine(1402)-N(4))-methyltransferase RsmH [Clostridia bacterium]